MIFADAISEGRPIRLFNAGNHSRDFTYVDDIAEGVVRAVRRRRDARPGLGPGGPRPRHLGGAVPDLQHRQRRPGPAPRLHRRARAGARATGRSARTCRCSPATCPTPGPTAPGSRPPPAGAPRPRSRTASPASSPGTATIPAGNPGLPARRPAVTAAAGRPARRRLRRAARLGDGRGLGEGRAMGRSAASIEGAPFGAVVPAPAGYLPPCVRAVIEEAAQAGLGRCPRPSRPHDPATPALVAVVRDEAPRLPGFLAHYRRPRGHPLRHRSTTARPTRRRALLAAAPDVDALRRRPAVPRQAGLGQRADRAHGLRPLVPARRRRRAAGLRRRAGRRPAGPRPRRARRASPRPAASGGCAACSSTSTRRGRCSRRSAREAGLARAGGAGPAVRRRRLCRGALPRAGLAQGRAATARLRLRPRADQVPAVPIRAGELVSSPHHLYPYPENYRSDCFLGLLHDKFGPGFRAKAERAAAEGNYWRQSLEYRATLAALDRDPGLALAYPGSRRYRAPADLVAAGLIAPIPWAGRPRLLARLAGWRRRRAVACA